MKKTSIKRVAIISLITVSSVLLLWFSVPGLYYPKSKVSASTIRHLRAKYAPRIKTGRQNAHQSFEAVKELLDEFDPIGATESQLTSILGAPTHKTDFGVSYDYDFGEVAPGFYFETSGGVITSWKLCRGM